MVSEEHPAPPGIEDQVWHTGGSRGVVLGMAHGDQPHPCRAKRLQRQSATYVPIGAPLGPKASACIHSSIGGPGDTAMTQSVRTRPWLMHLFDLPC